MFRRCAVLLHKQPKKVIKPTLAIVEKPVEEIYKELTPQEHVLLRPDMYIGSTRKETLSTWTAVGVRKKQEYREVTIVPGIAKIFDELLVNVADNYHRTRGRNRTTVMKVTIDSKTNTITIYNNGRCVDVEWHKDCEAYCPELVFGRFQAGSNFDDSEVRITGGRNGIGAKATNALSEEFTVEIGDARRRKLYRQTWRNSMKECSEPEITDYPKGEEYTKISFSPLLDYFGLDSLDEDHVALFSRRVADISACCSGLEVYLNDRLIPVGSFEEYVLRKYRDSDMFSSRFHYKVIKDKVNSLPWEIAVGARIGNHLSFVNSIDTFTGTHIAAVTGILTTGIQKMLKSMDKVDIPVSFIKDNISIFVNCQVGNPEFDGQTKGRLVHPSTAVLTDSLSVPKSFIEEIVTNKHLKNAIITEWEKKNQRRSKIEKNQKKKRFVLPKLEDAYSAGTRHSRDCTLILTEGDSAKSLAMAGVNIVGRDRWGVFPLRGKIMNVAKSKKANQLLSDVAKILGLDRSRKYTTLEEAKTLRYGSVTLMCDQDADGSHIKGLLVSWLHTYWSSLLSKGVPQENGTMLPFIRQIVTPLVKTFKDGKEKWFFSLQDYEKWEAEAPDSATWRVKYYKGLGTSTSKEGKEYFSELFSTSRPLLVNFKEFDEKDTKMLKLAFDDDRVQDRRRWLEKYEGRSLDTSEGEVAVADFVETDLASYFRHSNERAVPSCIDGLKPSHRKVLHTCFGRKLSGQKEMKVAQLGGAVAEMTAYHHGEASLHDCIIKLSQDYVGSGNNTPLLEGVGQFGTRLGGGADHASARYISTRLSPLARKLFREEDEPILEMKVDEGKELEPVFFIPILPVVLLNGALGIGTGHATYVPSYDPLAVASHVLDLINPPKETEAASELQNLVPWYHNHRTGYCYGGYSKGEYKMNQNDVTITELPVGRWTEKFKDDLDELQRNKQIMDYINDSTDCEVKFTVTMPKKKVVKATGDEAEGEHEKAQLAEEAKNKKNFEALLKLIEKRNITAHIKLFSWDGCLREYTGPEEVVREFVDNRLQYYEMRKKKILEKSVDAYEQKMKILRVCQLVEAGKLKLTQTQAEREALLEKNGLLSARDWLKSASWTAFSTESIATRSVDVKHHRDSIHSYSKVNAKRIWKNEVSEFVAAYVGHYGLTREQLEPRFVHCNPSVRTTALRAAAGIARRNR